jgi:hypothetical protein
LSHGWQVCVLGYLIICLALVLFVQSRNVYPQLLLGRLLFSLGGAAVSTMVTAVLPAVSETPGETQKPLISSVAPPDRENTSSPSLASEVTITPARYQNGSIRDSVSVTTSSFAATSRVAGLVGMLTGCGALIALLLFLPLPARFQKDGMSPDRALQHSFYIVAAVAFFLSLWSFIGLRNLRYEQHQAETESKHREARLSAHLETTWSNLLQAVSVGFQRADIALGYIGGFVARASSVGISLFIPLLVNAMFLSSHLCQDTDTADAPGGLPDIKRKCPRAYVVAAEMTGVCEMVALIAAPIFGYVSSRSKRRALPMMFASLAGVVGYPLFATQFDPDGDQKGKRILAFIGVGLIGVSQIGAIVCSLGILSHGVLSANTIGEQSPETAANDGPGEREALLGSRMPKSSSPGLSRLKGSVAGIYSFYGGAAILILTKVGGMLFDKVSVGAPFYIMAAFNGVLFMTCGILGSKVQAS